MKTLDIIKTANGNLLRNKIRSFLTILAIFVGSFTIILNTAINAGVNDFIDKQIASVGGDGYLEMMPKELYNQAAALLQNSGPQEYTEETGNSSQNIYIKEEQIEKAKKIDGIKSINALKNAQIDYLTSSKTEKRYRTTINVAVDGFDLDLSAGKKPDTSENAKFEVAINEDFISVLGFKDAEDAVGKEIQFAVPSTIKCYASEKREQCQTIITATISGVQAKGILAIGGPRVNTALWDEFNRINSEGMPSETSNRAFQAVADADPDKVDEIKKQLEEIGLLAMTIDDEVGQMRTFFDVILAVFNIFGAIALIAAAIGIVNTLLMSVQERTREIGLMKALGMSRFKIFFSFSVEAISLGFWGSVFGIAVSMILGNVANTIVHMDGGLLVDFPTFELVKFSPGVIIPIVLMIMFIAFVAGTAPALKAAKKDPIDALRYE
ncbi:ABC transporter permease [Candidatus Saccharibacteria bacterium]|nr:ABC transporter permease [Candidatus Saccharibacteria bacterium]